MGDHGVRQLGLQGSPRAQVLAAGIYIPSAMELHDAEDLLILKAVADHGTIVAAAEVLGVNRTTLWRRIQRMEWVKDEYPELAQAAEVADGEQDA